MLRSALVSIRLQRTELLLAAALIALTIASAAVAMSHAVGADPGEACWSEFVRTVGWFDRIPRACRVALGEFEDVAGEAGFISSPVAVLLPWVIGLLLGVPVVARELESGTAAMAWSLTGRRARWLLARLVPGLLLVVIGMAILSVVLTSMAEAADPVDHRLGPGRLPELGDLGQEGVTFLARSVAAFAIGTFLGAAIGRPMLALAIGAVASAVLSVLLTFGVQAIVAERTAVWVPAAALDDDRAYYLRSAGSGYLDREGRLLSPAGLEAEFARECPECGQRRGRSAQEELWQDRFETWRREGYRAVYRLVRVEAHGAFVAAEATAAFGVGMALVVLTFPVVSRRRPR